MIVQPDDYHIAHSSPSFENFGVYLISAFVVVLAVVKTASCFGRSRDEDEDGSTVQSFTIKPWDCFCNIFRNTEELGWSQDDQRFTSYSVKSMDIRVTDEKATKKCHLPHGIDGAGTATRKYLEAHGSEQQIPQADRRKLDDSRVIMKAYLISRLVAPRYTFDAGQMEFEERAEDRSIRIDEYKDRTQAMYDLLYSGQIVVDTRATRRQQRVALKTLRKSNLNQRPSKIRELAKQMKEEAEKDRCSMETGSSGLGDSACDISKAETTTDAISKHSSNRTESRFSRFLTKMGLRVASHDSAVGSSLGSIERLGGVAVIDLQHHEVTNNWRNATRQPLHTYGGAQF